MIDEHIYVCGGVCSDVDEARQVQVYSVNHRTWRVLPPSPQYNSQGVAVNNQLVLIGGYEASSDTITNLTSVWTGRRWHQRLPPMPTKRLKPGVTAYQNFILVAGGRAEDEQTLLSSIDILNIATRQWWTPNKFTLPQLMYAMQFTMSTAHLYVASAIISYDAATMKGMANQAVWQLPVAALENVLTTEGDSSPHDQWREIAPTPYYNSALLPDAAQIVAIGGDDTSDKPTSDVFAYYPESNKWAKVAQLGVPRACCAVVLVSRTSFAVCGGCTDSVDPKNSLLPSVEVVHV